MQIALLTLAAGSSADYTPFALGNPASIAMLEALDGIANPLEFLDRLRPNIEGRTAAAVIRHVAENLDYAISRAEAQTSGVKPEKLLADFVIENTTYRFDRKRRQPTVEFSVYNGSKDPISRIYLRGELTAPGRTLPLAVGGLAYRFPNPLQPGSQQTVSVTFATPGEWTLKQLETAYDTDFKLTVSNVDDSSGRRVLATGRDVLDTWRAKRIALRGS